MEKSKQGLPVISHIGPSFLQRVKLVQPQSHCTNALGNSDHFSL